MITSKNGTSRYDLILCVVDKDRCAQDWPPNKSTIVEIGKEISFDMNVLATYHYDGWMPVHRDLLVICAAVEFADRRRSRRIAQWARQFHLIIPVQELSLWQQDKVKEHLIDVLRHLTGDNWHFSFVQAESQSNPCQRSLPFDNNKKFAIAYSDGLDSRCVSGIIDQRNDAVRVRVSKNKDRKFKEERPFDLVPFTVSPKPSPENSVRSRGFKFAVITAIAGHLSGVNKIVVPESGQGALGPVLSPLHNIYADYRNHPTFFRRMELFLKTLLGYSVTYMQPRLWFTKGQTISTFLGQSGSSSEILLNTRSCWQKRHNVQVNGKRRQCGLCAACLLRRMSMLAAGILEPDDTYTFADLSLAEYWEALSQSHCAKASKSMVEHGSVGVHHLQQLAELADQPDSMIRQNTFEIAQATGMTEQLTMKNLRILLRNHAEEWSAFVSAQGKNSFINNWTKGGRYGRSK